LLLRIRNQPATGETDDGSLRAVIADYRALPGADAHRPRGRLTVVEPAAAVDLEQAAAQTVKRVLPAPPTEPDWTADPGLSRMTPFLETKTVWHPIGV